MRSSLSTKGARVRSYSGPCLLCYPIYLSPAGTPGVPAESDPAIVMLFCMHAKSPALPSSALACNWGEIFLLRPSLPFHWC